jgi:NADPH:quinone reductase-like Zn-dependent oxidoreductase
MPGQTAAYVAKFSADDPVSGLQVGPRPAPSCPPGWELVAVRAAAINHHDIWTLRGILSAPFDPPVTLGTDGAGVTPDGREVILHAVLSRGEKQHLLSEGLDGTLAEQVAVPSANLVAKPGFLSWEEAACLPTAWLTAWRMLFITGGAKPGEHVLVQGAQGGLATAAIQLAHAAGLRVTATSRTDEGLTWAHELGADEAVTHGTRLDRRADLVIDGVGAATSKHSLSSLAPGGRWIVAGVTTGPSATVDLSRVFWRELRILGVTMGSADDLRDLIAFLQVSGVRPVVAQTYPGLEHTSEAITRMVHGGVPGKLVVRVS